SCHCSAVKQALANRLECDARAHAAKYIQSGGRLCVALRSVQWSMSTRTGDLPGGRFESRAPVHRTRPSPHICYTTHPIDCVAKVHHRSVTSSPDALAAAK